jgi:hypothetical protein
MAAVAVGIFLATIDASIVNIALPVLGSVLCGCAHSIAMLISFRVLQAIGAAMTIAVSSAIITAAFPASERGKALGIGGLFVSVGIIAGPALGGIILGALSWHWIFFVNLPLGILGTILTLRFVPADRRPDVRCPGRRLPVPRAAVAAAGADHRADPRLCHRVRARLVWRLCGLPGSLPDCRGQEPAAHDRPAAVHQHPVQHQPHHGLSRVRIQRRHGPADALLSRGHAPLQPAHGRSAAGGHPGPTCPFATDSVIPAKPGIQTPRAWGLCPTRGHTPLRTPAGPLPPQG